MGGVVKVAGTWGSFAPLLAGYAAAELGRGVLYLCAHIEDAEKVADDLHTFGAEGVEVFSAWEGDEELFDAAESTGASRLAVAMKLFDNQKRFIITASIQSLCQPIPSVDAVRQGTVNLHAGKRISPEELGGWLVDNGFEHVEKVDLPGQFARRGGIIDIYSALISGKDAERYGWAGRAIRAEFFGDQIESIRQINLDTQRSSESLENIEIVSVICGRQKESRQLFTNILPKDTIIVLEEPTDIEDVAGVFLDRLGNPEHLFKWQDIYNSLAGFRQLHISRFAGADEADYLNVKVKSVQQYQQKSSAWTFAKESLEALVDESKAGKKVFLYCERQAEIKRLREIIEQNHKTIPSSFKLRSGFIDQGFEISGLNTIVISHHELFGQFAVRRRCRPVRPSLPIDSLEDLNSGDYVVHLTYGIGKYLGIKSIVENERMTEYLSIEYADKIKIHVSVNNITLVQKYIGTSPRRPVLSKIGTKKWLKQKEKVSRSVKALAVELLQFQAGRQATGGISFGVDTNWQAEFEESFPYQETADQITASGQIKSDMHLGVAMDRLLCGDVGYGKTELAMRAAFTAVEGGKQVAILVPTTVLCVQHARTFKERFADFPISIEVLNRFRTPKEAGQIVAAAKNSRVDIIIGTHRLLSDDVGFADLGLLIIDEEQRFGVEAKEKLKKIRVNVDVLTMTATPIPRTLHMSLLGLRDISSLQTAPLDRRSVVTTVTAYSDQLIRKAILHELNRQGQVFFLHNRVKTIEKKSYQIRRLLSDVDAKVAIAHGQMPKKELERTMIDFVLGRVDVLVCTTIVESGLDIPNANTIFIDDADRFGLAELHQLRGRVGRYKHRAYAYMLLPKTRSITPIAARRLKAIEEYSHLGSGFRIALRDLEIRGAGNILGSEQSGHIQTVGYQMYCRLLADAVRKIRAELTETVLMAAIDLGFEAFIPKNYIPSDRQRLDIYRKIAIAQNNDDLKQTVEELTDVYGAVPEQVDKLIQLSQMRIAAGNIGIKAIIASKPNLVFSFTEPVTGNRQAIFSKVCGKVSMRDAKTVYLRLDNNYFEPDTLLRILRKIFS